MAGSDGDRGGRGGMGTADPLTATQIREIAAVLRRMRRPWWWRARRKLSRVVGLDLGLVRLGYLIDVDRDRFED